MIYLLIASTFILFEGMGYSMCRYGVLSCWSAYGVQWRDIKIHNVNIWSVINILAALLLVPVMIQLAVGSPVQFIGFLTPLILLLVAFTPDYATNKKQNIAHQIGAYGTAAMAILYSIFVVDAWWIYLITIGVFMNIMIFTKKKFENFILYLEWAIFVGTYIILYASLLNS